MYKVVISRKHDFIKVGILIDETNNYYEYYLFRISKSTMVVDYRRKAIIFVYDFRINPRYQSKQELELRFDVYDVVYEIEGNEVKIPDNDFHKHIDMLCCLYEKQEKDCSDKLLKDITKDNKAKKKNDTSAGNNVIVDTNDSNVSTTQENK